MANELEHDPAIEVALRGHPRLWMRQRSIDKRDGPLMPTPTHDDDVGPCEDSYAHLFVDVIKRYGMEIGTFDDLVIMEPADG